MNATKLRHILETTLIELKRIENIKDKVIEEEGYLDNYDSQDYEKAIADLIHELKNSLEVEA